jgi:hypothetical protein
VSLPMSLTRKGFGKLEAYAQGGDGRERGACSS